MYRFHILGLTHLPTNKKFSSCAFTNKNRKLAKMLVDLNHTVYFYGAEGSDVKEYCNSDKFHFVQTHKLSDIARDYGEGYNLPDGDGLGYPWRLQDFKHDLNTARKPSTLQFYSKCIDYINKIKKPDDFLLATQGQYHKPIADAVELFLTCESGIGYRGSSNGMFRAFESSYGQNFIYGSEHPFASINGSYYDRIIPNYFDPDDVEFSDKPGKYFLFIGRLIKRKGILTAYLATKHTGEKLLIAGQGGIIKSNGHLVDNQPQEFDIAPDSDWKYVGYADVEKRKELMKNAIATFVPTEYLEMFGGVNIESRLHGTPVITTDFGCFPEYVENNLDGYRCNTLQDFVDATKKVKLLDRKVVRQRAERFLMNNVAKQYQKWFNDLMNVYESAIDKNKRGWSRLK